MFAMWSDVDEPDVNITDAWDIEQYGGATTRSQSKPVQPKPASPPKPAAAPAKQTERVLVDNLTKAQDELLQKVQYKTGLLAGRDSLYLATRQYIEDDDSDVPLPTKRQVGAWLKGEPSHERQQTTGAAFAANKPVAIIRRSAPLSYVQFDAFQLDERELEGEPVTYKNKKGNVVTVPLVQKYAIIMVDAFSKFVWVRLLASPKGAGIAPAWDGLKTNDRVIAVAKALDSIFASIDQDLQDFRTEPPDRLKDIHMRAGSDNGGEMVGPDIERVMKKYGVKHEYGIKGRPMSQSLAESHVGVWKRRFANWVRARMDAVGEQNEDSKRAAEIKRSWPDLADTITASVNTAWMQQHPRPLSRLDVHYGDAATIAKVKEHQQKEAGKRSKAYEQDNKPKFAAGDIVRRRVAKSGKLDAAYSQRLYKITMVKQYTKVKRPAGFKIAPINDINNPEPGLYRAEQLQRVLVDDQGKPVQNPLSASDVEALNDPSKREYVPWKILERRGNRVKVWWKGFPRSDASWEEASKIKLDDDSVGM